MPTVLLMSRCWPGISGCLLAVVVSSGQLHGPGGRHGEQGVRTERETVMHTSLYLVRTLIAIRVIPAVGRFGRCP